MSQSGPAYEREQPKSIARAHRQHPNTSGETPLDETGVEPACPSRAVGHSIESREWREVPYSEAYLEFYEPCSWSQCFPLGPPDANEIKTVVLSRRHPTKYHRPLEADSSEPAHDPQAPVFSITDLRKGEGVIWDGQSTPLRVVEPATDPNGEVRLAGPDGGNYRIEGRPNKTRIHAVYPAIGIITDLRRVPPDDRSETV